MRRYMETQIRPLILMMTALIGLGVVDAHADPAPFDLAGPVLEVKVTRGEKTLPIAEVPNLAGGDRLWIQADHASHAIRALLDGGSLSARLDQSTT